MQLARAAAARTLTNWAEPEHPPASEPPSTPAVELQSDPATAPHPGPAPRRATAQIAGVSSYKPTDPAVLFTRLAAVVRDCIALEARLTAGARPITRAPCPRFCADPRRVALRDAFDRAIENDPDRADLLRKTATHLDEELAADADQAIVPGHLFVTLCHELGIELDLATLPDNYLTAHIETTTPNEAVPRAPYPRATSPP
jgi:hypothetical protein